MTTKSIQDIIPRSRLNLRYRTMIEGELKEVELPFRIMLMGDLSHGSSTDREIDLESRRLRTLDGRNLDAVIENMRITLKTTVKNRVAPSDETLDVSIPIKSRASFNPDQVAVNVPKIRGLMLLRKLILEMQSSIDNRKELRRLVQEIWSSPEQLQKLQKELEAYASYRLQNSKSLPAAEQEANQAPAS